MIQQILNSYSLFKCTNIFGRYLHFDTVNRILDSLPLRLVSKSKSVNKLDINLYSIGKGKTKLFFWSQMHGNESTTTKALIDFLFFLESNHPIARKICNTVTLYVIPQLNPDGSIAYTRFNANAVDLNRDAKNQSQPESIFLQDCISLIKPEFCFNLHDQRTLFSVGYSPKPATLSFLAPAGDSSKTVTKARIHAMALISKMIDVLNPFLQGQISRFDDSFNINCIGDNLMSKDIPVMLIEAGHFQGDYQREETRKWVCMALILGTLWVSEVPHESEFNCIFNHYNKIPQNQKLFYDIIISNNDIGLRKKDLGIQYIEYLKDEKIHFILGEPQLIKADDFFGHQTILHQN